MKTKEIQPSYKIIEKGMHSLIDSVGPKGMLEFFRFFYSGKGDSVKEFKEMWRGLSIDDIHNEILERKNK